MATDRYEQDGSPLGSLIKTAIGLSPLAYGAYRSYSEIKSNAALNPAVALGVGPGSGGNLPTVTKAVGAILGANVKDNRANDLTNLRKLQKRIMESDKLDEIWQKMEERNAVVQSLLETLDDPTNGLLSDNLLNQKQKLVDLSRDINDIDQLKETVQKLVETITTQAPESTQLRFARNFREYRKLGPVLTPPSPDQFKVTHGANSVEPSALGKAAKDRYNRLVAGLGSGGAGRVHVVSTVWGGVPQYYAQVFSSGAGRSSLQGVLPLHVDAGNTGVKAIFANQNLTTGYAAPRQFADAKRAQDFLARPGVHTADKLIAHAGIEVEDYFLDQFLNRMKDGQLVGGSKAYNEWKNQFMEAMPRALYSQNNPGVNKHLNAVMAQATNFLNIVNMEGLDRSTHMELMKTIGVTPGFDAAAPGYTALARGIGNQAIGRVAIAANSPIASVRSIGTATRGYFPVESRLEQVFHGGGAMFVGDRPRRMGRGKTLTAGPTAIARGSTVEHIGQNIEWAENLTGATNKAVIMPTKGRMYEALQGTGSAISTGTQRVRSFTTKPILDPSDKNYMASKLFMEDIVERAKKTADGVVRLDRADIEKYGGFLGIGPQGTQHLRMDPRMQSMDVAYSVTVAHNKKQINIMANVDRDMDMVKVFGLMHKGTVESLPGPQFAGMLNELGFNRKRRRSLRVRNQDVMIADPSMIKKGAGFFDLQLRGGYGFVSGDVDFHTNLERMAKVHTYKSLPFNYKTVRNGVEVEMPHSLGRTVGAVLRGLSDRVKAGKVSVEDAGDVLAGIYNKGGAGKGQWLNGANAAMAIERDALDVAMKEAFGKHYNAVKAVAEQGNILTAGSFVQGTGQGDWGQARGSVEPRFITNLQHRLKNMGLSTDQAAEIIAGVYKNKIGFGQGLKAAAGFKDMLGGLTGTTGLIGSIEQTQKGLATYNLTDLPNISKEGFVKLLQKHPDGFMLDLTAGADSPATRAIAANAADVFRSNGPIFIPGRDVADAMRETQVSSARDIAGDSRNRIIYGEYTEMMDGLLKKLSGISSQTLGAPEDSRKLLEGFKNQAIGLASDTIMSLPRGKIRGMSAMVAISRDMNHGLQFANDRQFKFAKDLFRRTRGQSVYMDSYGFLSQLNDWMGNSNNPGIVRDAAKKAEMFFLSTRDALRTGDAGKAKGVMQLTTRHPEVGLGNITPVQVFRHLGELGAPTAMDKKIFGLMGNIQGQWKGITSWDQVQSKPANERMAFFTSMMENLHTFAPEGGGSLFMPQMKGAVKIAGVAEAVEVDFGIAAAGMGDFDGDQWMSMMLDRESSKTLLGTLEQGAQSQAWLEADARYKIHSQIYGEEAKNALKRLNGGELDYEGIERIKQSMMKEQAGKGDIVGRLDTQLNKLRLAVLDLDVGPSGREGVTNALAFLKMVQEHASIKGKKLPIFLPFAEMLAEATKVGFEKGDMSAFQDVIQNVIFKDSELFGKGLTVESVSSGLSWADSIANERVHLQPVMDLLTQAMQTAKTTGIADTPNPYWMAKLLGGTPEQAQHVMTLLNAGETVQAGFLSGSQPKTGQALAAGAESLMHRIQSTLSTADRRMLGIGAAAVAGSLGLLAMIGHGGYSPEPMTVDGEMVSPDVRAAIGRGDLLTPAPSNRSTGQYATAQPDMTSSIYLSKPNAYQVSGQVRDMRQANLLGDYVGSLPGGSRGTIRVNDTRRPVSSSYSDRILGEY